MQPSHIERGGYLSVLWSEHMQVSAQLQSVSYVAVFLPMAIQADALGPDGCQTGQ